MSNTIDINRLCMGCMSLKDNSDAHCTKCGFDSENSEQPHHHLKLWTILSGKYLVGRALGEGGFGITYLGWDLNLDIKVAIKEYYPVGLVTRETTATGLGTVAPFTGNKGEIYRSGLEKFVNEAKSLAKFSALPGIVSVKDFFRENGTAYIVMEYIQGITLKQYLSQHGGKIPADSAFELMKPIMKALSKIHQTGIIHRDISPDNIMLTSEGEVKLLDFGAARDYLGDDNKSLSVLLKPGYAPEEQYRTKGNQGPWTDVYALCATLYKMITGETPPESLDRYAEDVLVSPSQHGVVLSPHTESALLKGLSIFQKDRYQNVDQLDQALFQAVESKDHEILGQVLNQGIVQNAGQDLTVALESEHHSDPSDEMIVKRKSGSQKVLRYGLIGAAAALLVGVIILSMGDRGLGESVNKETPSHVAQESKGAPVSSTPLLSEPIAVSPTPEAGNGGEEIETSTPTPVAATPEVLPDPALNRTLSGNTSGNIANDALVAKLGDWVFYSNQGLWKMKPDGSEKTLLHDQGYIWYLNPMGDQLYFIEAGSTGQYTLYKIGMNDTKAVRVLKGPYQLCISGDWLYFTHRNDNYSLYRMRADGSEQKKLSDQDFSTFFVSDDWIYFSLMNDKLQKMKLDGSSVQVVTDDNPRSFCVLEDWIYYINFSDGDCIYKIRTDGSERQKLGDDACTYLNVDGQWIYYQNVSDNNNIYRMDTEGNGRQALNSDKCNFINLMDDWVYYSSSWGFYRMRTDGSQQQSLK